MSQDRGYCLRYFSFCPILGFAHFKKGGKHCKQNKPIKMLKEDWWRSKVCSSVHSKQIQVYQDLLFQFVYLQVNGHQSVILFKIADSTIYNQCCLLHCDEVSQGDDLTLTKQQRNNNLMTGSPKYDNITGRREYLSRNEMPSSYCICGHHCKSLSQ